MSLWTGGSRSQDSISADMTFQRWEDVIKLGKLADAVIIGLQVRSTSYSRADLQDAHHAAAVAAFSAQGYHIMCEKPMATTIPDCVNMLRDLTSPSMEGKVFAVGHVMRYSPYNIAVRRVIDSGVLGDIVDVQVSILPSTRYTADRQHTEPVGNQHFAHSFVRGHWGNEAKSTFALMSKCCQ